MTDAYRKLTFPVFKDPPLKPRRLSMDAYARFVQFGWEHAARRDEQRQRSLQMAPTRRFILH